ncbi:glycosyltransferase family 39 protein [Tessaracoccus lubricantis]|uniref:Glycosyltransferase family 39 protein n=1 Tax=Tessaracoccus lubricantis TaxID=545543 RepID=A0ABP9F4D5_9ACTN
MGSVGAYLTVKGLFLATLAVVVGSFPLAKLTAFDAGWYLTVVDEGYGVASRSNLAFFPLLPGLARIPMALGVPSAWAVLVMAWLGSVVAVVGIHRVGAELGSAAVGFWLAFCWAVAPRSHVQVMGYAEGWFTAFVAWGLWAMLTRRRWLAGFMGLLAGLTQASALVYIGVLWLWWLAGVVGNRGQRGWRARLCLERLGAAALGSAGFALFWLYVAYRTGSITGYLDIRRDWNSVAGSPWPNLVKTWNVLTPGYEGTSFTGLITPAIAIALAVVLLLVMIYMREHWLAVMLLLLGLVLVLMQQEDYHSKARMLMPWFVMWLPLARLFARCSAWVMVPVALTLTVVSVMWGLDAAAYRYSP